MESISKQDFNLMFNKLLDIEKKFDNFKKAYQDLEFEKRTLEAYQRIQDGKGIEMDFDEAIDEMKKW